jgi:A/G-specific adenine glycosylase
MLQQTQVSVVEPYYRRWMSRFPTIADLASAEEDDVLAMWQGLGYYRRAKSLLRGAREMAMTPTREAEWRDVAGVGRYTAAAIASIAFNEPCALVDGNVERVYARICNDDSSGSDLTKNAWHWAGDAIHPQRPGDWNQALMELGATVCTPTNPKCDLCPIAEHCRALRVGTANELPLKTVKPSVVHLVHHVWVPIVGDCIGMSRISPGQWWAGMWGLPRSQDPAELQVLIPHAHPESVGTLRHTVTRHRIQLHVFRVRLKQPTPGLEWFEIRELDSLAMPAPQRRAMQLALSA